eukprot:3559284-Pleurochrysis_carterae.AAC.2
MQRRRSLNLQSSRESARTLEAGLPGIRVRNHATAMGLSLPSAFSELARLTMSFYAGSRDIVSSSNVLSAMSMTMPIAHGGPMLDEHVHLGLHACKHDCPSSMLAETNRARIPATGANTVPVIT